MSIGKGLKKWVTLMSVGCLISAGYARSSHRPIMALFTITSMPLIHIPHGITPCVLDLPLPTTAAQQAFFNGDSEETTRAWLTDHPQQLAQWATTYACRAKAGLLHLQKLPAIVFNHKGVIYGQTDVATALATYQAYHAQKKSTTTGEVKP